MTTMSPATFPAPRGTGSAIRLIHAALLLQGGTAMAAEFWSGHPLEGESDEILSGAELFEHLWQEESRYPLEWVLRVVGSLESFCLRYGLDFGDFLERRILDLHGGSPLSPRANLRLAGRFLETLLHSPDIRLTLLRLIDQSATENAATEGLRLRLLRHERSGDVLTAWMLLDSGAGCQLLKQSDLCSWVATVLRQAPRRWGAECFEEVTVLADLRGMEFVGVSPLPNGLAKSASGDWRSDGKVVTRPVSLKEWVQGLGEFASLLPATEPSIAVQLAERDWTCPQRGRRIVSQGTVFGAPWGLFRIRWHLDDAAPVIGALSRLIFEATDAVESPEWIEASQLHFQLVENDRHRLNFVYHTSDETISCNGSHLLRGVPAKILQKVLLAHTVTGRTIFEHREFRRDPDLNLDPANPNLESRLRLLSERLEERLPGLRLAKAGRGRFQLEARIQVAYAEDVPALK